MVRQEGRYYIDFYRSNILTGSTVYFSGNQLAGMEGVFCMFDGGTLRHKRLFLGVKGAIAHISNIRPLYPNRGYKSFEI